MNPDELIFEGGMHPSHNRTDPVERSANLGWFATQWRLLKIGGVLGTSMGAYVKTETGFRRVPMPEPKERRG